MKTDTREIIIVLKFNLSDNQKMHLSINEREYIMKWLAQWLSKRTIARFLWRHPSTICDEVNRNKVRWEYSANKAQHKAYVNRLHAKRNLKKIRMNDKLEQYVREKMKDDWSPEIIAWRWNTEHEEVKISTPTIYKYVHSRFAYDLPEHLYMNRNGRRRKKGNGSKGSIIKNRVFIDCRPEIISKLLQFGHYEADLIVWPQWTKEVILVFIEKVSRLKIARKLPNKKAETIEKETKKWIKILWMKSITFDNGTEFANHYKLWIPTYFTNPYHSREKWQVERWNREYRRYFPKKTERKKISQKEIDKITIKINNKPMKVLDFKCPIEIYQSHFKKFSLVSVFTL